MAWQQETMEGSRFVKKNISIDESLALLVVFGINWQGQKKLLALEEGYRESIDFNYD